MLTCCNTTINQSINLEIANSFVEFVFCFNLIAVVTFVHVQSEDSVVNGQVNALQTELAELKQRMHSDVPLFRLQWFYGCL